MWICVDLCRSVWLRGCDGRGHGRGHGMCPKTNPGVYRPTLRPLGRISRKPMVREWLGSARITYNIIQRHRFLTRGGGAGVTSKGVCFDAWLVQSSVNSEPTTAGYGCLSIKIGNGGSCSFHYMRETLNKPVHPNSRRSPHDFIKSQESSHPQNNW